MVDRILCQLSTHAAFRRHDSFVTTYITGPFMAHIAKSRREDPFHLGTIRRLVGEMPVRVGAGNHDESGANPSGALPHTQDLHARIQQLEQQLQQQGRELQAIVLSS